MNTQSIYTKQAEGKNPLTESYKVGDRVVVTILKSGDTRYGEVCSFPRNSWHDTNHRMEIKPVNGDWFGRVVISTESNGYGQYHISEVMIGKEA